MLRYGLKSFCSSPRRLPSYRSSVNSGVLETIRTVKTVVWWDMNCSAHEDYLCAIYNRIGTALESRGMESPVWINAYGNYSTQLVKDSAQEELSSSGVRLFHVPLCETTSSLLPKHMMTWSTYNSPPICVMLITKDNKFTSIIQHLTRLKFVVILSCDTPRTTSLLCKASTFVWPWQPLSKGLTLDSMQFNDVLDMIYWIRDANRKSVDLIKALPKSTEPKEAANAKSKADSDLKCASTTDSSPDSIDGTDSSRDYSPDSIDGTDSSCDSSPGTDSSPANPKT